MKFKVGQKFGKATLTSIQGGKYNFMCDCNRPFSVTHKSITINLPPQQCKTCADFNRGVGTGKASMCEVRKLTKKEENMIADFDKKVKKDITKIKNKRKKNIRLLADFLDLDFNNLDTEAIEVKTQVYLLANGDMYKIENNQVIKVSEDNEDIMKTRTTQDSMWKYTAMNENKRINKFTHKPIRSTFKGLGIWIVEDLYLHSSQGVSSSEYRELKETLTWQDEPLERTEEV